ncbi:hypothetical protein LTS18_002762 [Coniosporium uncinatum]|uniref:Uncharacterized protein n=1 Tax=Coniosporium uncinatum TaxID=93489 RepID=A0ACC3DU66_9PEZI|nr:hypothetical protein LTS18_002762 [Coniosporium uncinatum]
MARAARPQKLELEKRAEMEIRRNSKAKKRRNADGMGGPSKKKTTINECMVPEERRSASPADDYIENLVRQHHDSLDQSVGVLEALVEPSAMSCGNLHTSRLADAKAMKQAAKSGQIMVEGIVILQQGA